MSDFAHFHYAWFYRPSFDAIEVVPASNILEQQEDGMVYTVTPGGILLNVALSRIESIIGNQSTVNQTVSLTTEMK